MSREQAIAAALHARPNAPHTGPIMTHGPGRTDNVDMGVAADSFVIPADIVSALGEGNTMAGMKVLDRMFGPHAGGMKAGGKPIPIVAAGGEYVMSPAQVAKVGGGDPKRGHAILDAFVKQIRAKTIKTLKKLPGPARK